MATFGNKAKPDRQGFALGLSPERNDQKAWFDEIPG
jgi:hypothetical protein